MGPLHLLNLSNQSEKWILRQVGVQTPVYIYFHNWPAQIKLNMLEFIQIRPVPILTTPSKMMNTVLSAIC